MVGAIINGDHIVIGSGLAGFSAAVTLKTLGKEVVIVTKGVGASAISSGAWDFGPIRSSWEKPFAEIRESAEWKLAYRHLLVESNPVPDSGQIAATLEMLQAAFGNDLKLSFRYDRPYCLPTTSGNWRYTYGAQEIQTRADISRWANQTVGLVISPQWRLHGRMLARQLSEMAQEMGDPVEIVPLALDLSPQQDWALPNFAMRYRQDAELRKKIADKIRAALPQGCAAVFFPPLFLEVTQADELSAQLGIPVAECLATNEPIPGYRLQIAMDLALVKLGIGRHVTTHLQAEHTLTEILSLEVSKGRALRGDRYYLATGKFLGGGIALDYREVSEPLFQLPVFRHRTFEPVQFRSQLPLIPDAREAQPWAELGIWLNQKWQPRDQNNQPVFENLYACGSVIGGVDFARHNIGLGFMAWSGRQCALVDA